MADSDVSWGVMLVAGDQPPRAAWAKLIAELRSAGMELTGGKPPSSSQLPPGMVPILRSLTALNDYLSASAVVKVDPRISVPLLQLMAAIYKTQLPPAPPGEPPDATKD